MLFKILRNLNFLAVLNIRATLTGRYSFKEGPLKGLTLGLSQQYRSGSEQTKFNFYFDENNNQVNQANSIRSETYYLKFLMSITL